MRASTVITSLFLIERSGENLQTDLLLCYQQIEDGVLKVANQESLYQNYETKLLPKKFFRAEKRTA